MPFDSKTLVPIAHVGKPHGLLGGFFAPLSAHQKWAGYTHLYLIEKDKDPIKVAVGRSYTSGGRLVLILENYTTRNAVEVLKGALLAVHRNQIALETEEWLVHDLVGCAVWVSATDRVGVVQAVKGFGAQDCLEIVLDKGGDSVLYPFLEPFVISVDLEKKVIFVQHEPAFLGEVECP